MCWDNPNFFGGDNDVRCCSRDRIFPRQECSDVQMFAKGNSESIFKCFIAHHLEKASNVIINEAWKQTMKVGLPGREHRQVPFTDTMLIKTLSRFLRTFQARHSVRPGSPVLLLRWSVVFTWVKCRRWSVIYSIWIRNKVYGFLSMFNVNKLNGRFN